MANDPEAQAQLARLLGDSSLRAAERNALHDAVERGMHRISAGLLAEVAASDDVIDRESAYEFLRARLDFLGALLSDGQRSRLWDDLRGKIDAW